MNTKNDQKETEATILTPKEITILIPDCCRLGLPDCKHIPQKMRKVKRNIGL